MPHRPWPILAAIAICLLLLACSSAPPTSQNDASFTDARNNFKASDFKAAWRNLNNVGKGSSDESQRQHAIVLRTALVTALADANKQMAGAYYIGAKPPRGSRIPAPITKCARTTTTPRARSWRMGCRQ